METIKIELGDWLKNAGILGLVKILERKMERSEQINLNSRVLEFDIELLDGLEEVYFDKLIEINKKQITVGKIIDYRYKLESIKSALDNEKERVKYLKELDEKVKYIKTKLTSNSYKSGYLLIEDSEVIEKLISKIDSKALKTSKKEGFTDNKKLEIEGQIENLLNIIDYLSRKDVYRVLAAKNVMYDVIQFFWSGVSILHASKEKSTGDMYSIYKEDFIDTARAYEKSSKEKFKYNCFTCENKIAKLSKPAAYDITWLTKIGADAAKKSSHFWNMTSDAYVCPICNLVYSCVPLGFNVLNGKGIFINSNINIESLKMANIVKFNDVEDGKLNFQEIENLSYYNVVKAMDKEKIESLEYELENTQVVKFDADNSTRPYSFNILSKQLMYIMYKHKKAFSAFMKVRVKITEKYYLSIYDEVVRRLYDGKNLFDLIGQLLFLNLSGKFRGIRLIYSIININNSLLGGKGMYYKDTENFKNYGLALRKGYENKNSTSKLSGITYRLLNALKTKDSSKFMDTLVNAHLYIGKPIPTDFTKALNNVETLQGAGYAFIIGLQGNEDKKDIEKGGNSNEN